MTRGIQKEEIVAVAIDKDKGSHQALKWTVDRLLSRGQALTLIHVKQKPFSAPNSTASLNALSDSSSDEASMTNKQLDIQARDFFLPFRCLCTRKEIQCNEVILEDVEIAKTLINYVNKNWIDILVLGAPSKSGLVRRFKSNDVPSTVSKGAPDFCTVYIIAKGKVSSVRQSTSPSPPKPTTAIANTNPPRNQLLQHQSTFSASPFPHNNNNNKLQHQSTSSNIASPRSQLQHQVTCGNFTSPRSQLQHQVTGGNFASPRSQLQHQVTIGNFASPRSQLQHQSTNVSEAAADANQMRPQPSRSEPSFP